jgi:hypothetical protein
VIVFASAGCAPQPHSVRRPVARPRNRTPATKDRMGIPTPCLRESTTRGMPEMPSSRTLLYLLSRSLQPAA